jgi:hypothetical protein
MDCTFTSSLPRVNLVAHALRATFALHCLKRKCHAKTVVQEKFFSDRFGIVILIAFLTSMAVDPSGL